MSNDATHLTARTTDDGLRIQAGDFFAATPAGKSNTKIFEVTEVLEGNYSGRRCFFFKGMVHTFGRRNGWVVGKDQVQIVRRDTIAISSRENVEQLGKAANAKRAAYWARKG